MIRYTVLVLAKFPVDLLVALAALVWALVALYQPPLAALCSAEFAFAGATAAAARGVAQLRANLAQQG